MIKQDTLNSVLWHPQSYVLCGRQRPCFVLLADVFGVGIPIMVDLKLSLWLGVEKSSHGVS